MPTRPTLEEVKSKATPSASDVDFDEHEALARTVANAAIHHVQGLADFYRSRNIWSWFLIFCILASLAFQISLTVLIGMNILDYRDYKWFVQIVTAQSFFQVVGLSAIVLKWLFSGATPNKMLEGRD